MRISLNTDHSLFSIFREETGFSDFPQICGIAIDSRVCKQNDLFIALPGEKADGHEFLEQAFHNGASAALVSRTNNSFSGKVQIVVDSPLRTIGSVAKAWRSRFTIPVIGITGSNGKTSTKDLLSHILKSQFRIHATAGNYNTTISLPLTLLGLTSNHDISVLELGASAPGEIKYLSSIAQPTHGLITNIAPAHLEGFGSLESIIKEKRALFESLKGGTSFINADDENLRITTVPGKKISFGSNIDCDRGYVVERKENGYVMHTKDFSIDTYSMNMSFVKNCMAAATIALELGITPEQIKDRIRTSNPSKGRCEVKKFEKCTVIDDTYNANLQSVKAAIDYLVNFTGQKRKLFFFGDMKELGYESKNHHTEVGKYVVQAGIYGLITIGNDSRHASDAATGLPFNLHFDTLDDLDKELSGIIEENDIILVKGSRSMKLEKIIKSLESI